MSSEELKPCPFCGGDQIVHSSVWSSHEGRHVQTYECKGCHSFARVAQWNTRTQLAAIQGGMGEAVAYRHTMHKELGQKMAVVSVSAHQPFGVCGEDFDGAYTVTTEPLYTTPPASPDVEGLVKALESARDYIGSQPVKTSPWRDGIRSGLRLDDGAMGTLRILDKIDTALSTWRQAQEGKA